MLRKIAIITSLALLVSSSAFATGTITATTTMTSATTGKSLYASKTTAGPTTSLIGKNSTGAATGVFSTSAGYGLTTQHMNGTKAFGTSHDSTAIYSSDVTKGTFFLNPVAVGTAQFSAWTSM